MKILVVEDERTIAGALEETLEKEGYAVDLAPTGEAASEAAAVNDYDLIILDRSIPPPTGLELLAEWRAEGLATPVLMLTGHGSVEDRVEGLDEGADDYLTKPFRFEELLARVRSLLRRKEKPLVDALEAGDVHMDRATRRVTVAGEPVNLSPKERALLEYLLTHKGRVVSRTELSEHVWDSNFDAMSNTIDVLVHRLRKKIGDGGEKGLLQTIVGSGYLLEDPPE